MILVTGASGNVGACLVRLLARAGEPVRALARHAPATPWPAGVQFAAGDLSRAETLGDALAGVDRMFLFTPPTGCGEVARAARTAGVRRVVLLSSSATQKADPRTNPIAARHAAAEQAVRDAALAWTILRPDSFATNALAWASDIRAHGVVRAAYGRSLRNPIHEADVAEVALAALLRPEHEAQAHALTGPAALTQIEQVAAIGQAIGRALRFEEQDRAQALASMSGTLPPGVAERLLDYAARSVDHPPAATDTVQRLLGRPARTFAQWARDHAADFA